MTPIGGSDRARVERLRARQLTLDLAGAPSFARDEFLVSPSNARAHATIEAWPEWPDNALILCGPAGSGKSHLGAIWAARTGATIILPTDLLEPGAMDLPIAALVEDCDRGAYPEAALFHLANLARETNGSVILTARCPPSQWGLQTPDLLSRLRRAPLVAIETPDGGLLRAVIIKLFSDRQIRIEEDVVAYAALHCDQSLEAISVFVAAVDDDALAMGRRITRSLAARTLARLHDETPTTD